MKLLSPSHRLSSVPLPQFGAFDDLVEEFYLVRVLTVVVLGVGVFVVFFFICPFFGFFLLLFNSEVIRKAPSPRGIPHVSL